MQHDRRIFSLFLSGVIMAAVVGWGCGSAAIGLSSGTTQDGSDEENGGDSTVALISVQVAAPVGVSGSVSASKSVQDPALLSTDVPVASATCTLKTLAGTVVATAVSDASGLCKFSVPAGTTSGDLIVVAQLGDAVLSSIVTVATAPALGDTVSVGDVSPTTSVAAELVFSACEDASGRTVTTEDPAGCASADAAGTVDVEALAKAVKQLAVISTESGDTDTSDAEGAFGNLLSNARSAMTSGRFSSGYLRNAIGSSTYAGLKQTTLATRALLLDRTLVANVEQRGEWGTVAKCLAAWGSSAASGVAASPALVRDMMRQGSAQAGGLDFCKSPAGALTAAYMTTNCSGSCYAETAYDLVKTNSWDGVEVCNAPVVASALANIGKQATDSTTRVFTRDNAGTIISSVMRNPLAFAGSTGATVANRMMYMGATEGYPPTAFSFCRQNSDCGSSKVCSITNTCVSDAAPGGNNLPVGVMCTGDSQCASGNCEVMVSSGSKFCAPSTGFVIPTTGPATMRTYEVGTSLSPEASIGECLTAPSSDAVTPAVLSTNPVCGSNGFPLNQTFRITFNQPMDASTITTSTIAVTSQDGALNGTVSYSGTSALFTPAVPLQNGFTYTIRASTGAQNTKGVALPSAFSCTVTTRQAAPGSFITRLDSTFMLRGDGRLWAWGRNNYGQLGDGTQLDRNRPQPVPGLGGVTQAALSRDHALAITSDGSLWAWGWNAYGQLGEGTTTDRLTPTRVSVISGVSKVEALFGGSAVLKTDGTVWVWGQNSVGQLGNNSVVNSVIPVQVGSGGCASGVLSGVTDLACGLQSCYALISGEVWAWGGGTSGQMGNNAFADSSCPIHVLGVGGVGFLANVSKVVSGNNTVHALRSNGSVVAWGNNTNAQVGDGTTSWRSAPYAIPNLASGVRDIGSSNTLGMALKTDGTVYVWGIDGGTGNSVNFTTTPIQISGLTGVSKIGAGAQVSLLQKEDGTTRALGSNKYGLLGSGSVMAADANGRSQSGLSGVTQLGDGGCWTLHAYRPSERWYAWGRNADNEVRSGGTTGEIIFAPVEEDIRPVNVAGSCYSTFALMPNGTIVSWGRNNYGQLGDGTQVARSSHATTVSGLTNVAQIAAGRDFAMARKSDGTVWTWGNNTYKQIADGTTTHRLTPYQVSISNVTDIAGSHFALALKEDGTVWAWGFNAQGQVGDNTESATGQASPVQVHGVGNVGYLAGIRQVSSGNVAAYAVDQNSGVYAWGYGGNGNLGNNTWDNSATPVRVLDNQLAPLSGVADLCRNPTGQFMMARKSDGTVWAWGDNTLGVLGDGTTFNRNVATPVVDYTGQPITTAVDIQCGLNDAAVLTQDGRVIVWGHVAYGGLVQNSVISSSVLWP